MDELTKSKLRPLLMKSRTGQLLSDADHDFVRDCFRKWPKEYSALHKEVVEDSIATVNPLYRKKD